VPIYVLAIAEGDWLVGFVSLHQPAALPGHADRVPGCQPASFAAIVVLHAQAMQLPPFNFRFLEAVSGGGTVGYCLREAQ